MAFSGHEDLIMGVGMNKGALVISIGVSGIHLVQQVTRFTPMPSPQGLPLEYIAS